MIKFLQTPTKAKKIVLGALLTVVAVMMVITLIPGIFEGLTGTAGRGVYARVGGHDVTSVDVDRQAQQMARQQRLPAEFVQFVRAQAANQLITKYALIAEARRIGLHATDDEVRDFLHQGQFGQMLFPQGNFIGQQSYENFVTEQFRMSVADFENLVKDQLLIQKLIAVIQGPITVPESEVKNDYIKQNRKVKFAYAVLTQDQIAKQVKVTDTELKAYYDKHKQEYVNSIPEKRKARYIVINSSTIAGVSVGDDEIRQYYNQHTDQYKVPDRVHVRHILIKTPAPASDGKVDQKAVDAAKAKAEGLLKQIQNGANFEELAKKNSDDPGSAKQGGELPAFQHGAMVPEFEQAAFALQNKGQLSGLVKSTYGYHIIQLIDKQSAHLKPLDEVKADILPILKQQKESKAADELARTLESQSKAQGLDKAAAAHNLKVEISDYFSNTDALPGIGQAPDFMQVAFSTKPKSPPVLAHLPNGYALLEITDDQPAKTPTFEEAKPKVETAFRNEQAQSLLQRKTEELSERAKALHELKKAAAEAGAQYKISDFVTQQGQVPDLGSMSGPASVAFTLSKNQISGPINSDRNGAVLEILDQQEPSAEEFAKNKDSARERTLEQKRGQAFQLYASTLVEKMEKDGRIRYNRQEQQANQSGRLPSGS
ncbi:MAG TPA: peptidyl-prolyl cis-trans isomerase [Terriglobales bacterium]|nr:peptidyl-prolyl cis-trans isomerase [Terriglobales bacterium]